MFFFFKKKNRKQILIQLIKIKSPPIYIYILLVSDYS